MEEIWKDVINYEGLYQVSNLGRVKSLNYNHTKKEGYLKCGVNQSGYFFVALYLNGKAKNYMVHQLVAMTFLNHSPCGFKLVIDHINDVKTDNRVENLQIVTNRENSYKTQGNYSSLYKGVSWNKNAKKWMSYIKIKGKLKYLGLFTSELEASEAYQKLLKNLN